MGRKDYQYYPITCVGGIDQQEGLGDPQKTCTDARDVWAPDGKLMRRPGYVGVSGELNSLLNTSEDATLFGYTTGGGFVSVDGSGNLILTGLVNPIVYIGHTVKFTGQSIQQVSPNNDATNPLTYVAEYWNGTQWKALTVNTVNDDSRRVGSPGHDYNYALPHILSWSVAMISNGYVKIDLVAPTDWASTTVNSVARYYVRYRFTGTIQSPGVVKINASNGASNAYAPYADNYKIRGLFNAKMSSRRRVIYSESYPTALFATWAGGALITRTDMRGGDSTIHTGLGTFIDKPSVAVVADFDETYVACGFSTYKLTAADTNLLDVTAKVEDNPYLVGPASAVPAGTIIPYNKDPSATGYIDQLTEWPRSKLLTYFRGEMWAAGFDGSPSQVRWSAPQPYYKVWPTLNTEFLIQNDSTPITALYGFQQNMLVFKQNSIWRMVDTGISANKLQTYVPECVVNGIGTISANSIASVVHAGNYGIATDMLAFLAEDGIYLYNSGATITKISQRIYRTIASINPSLRSEAVGVNWKEKNLYLLSVAVDGADHNNLTIVWDYKNDSWWLWTIGAQSWLYDYDGISVGKMYFGDNHGQIFQLDIGDTDYGAQITPYVTSQRVAFDGTTRRLRQIEIHGNSRDRTMNLAVIRNDEPMDSGVTLSMKDGLEKDWSNLTYNVDHWVNERHRVRRAMFNKSGEWFQVKVAGSTTEPADFEVHDIICGFETLGRRR